MLAVASMLFMRRVEAAANRWLAAFLFIAALAQAPQIIGFSGFYAVWPGLTFAPFGVELYAGSLLYLHAYCLMVGEPLRWRRFLVVPGILQTLYYTWAFTSLGDYRSKWVYSETVHVPLIEPVETAFGLVLLLLAMIAIFRLTARYRDFLNDTQSAAADFDPVWLHRLMLAMVGAGLLFAALELAPYVFGPISYVGAFPAQILLAAIIAWLGFQALAQTTVAFPKLSNRYQSPGAGDESAVSIRDWDVDGQNMARAVLNGGWYLESRLSIRDVASRLHSNETYVSRAVNKGLGVTFNAFVNGLRVDYAKDLIRKGEQSFLDIAAAAGFNSKATFNRVFRELVGQTPSQFKRSQNP